MNSEKIKEWKDQSLPLESSNVPLEGIEILSSSLRGKLDDMYKKDIDEASLKKEVIPFLLAKLLVKAFNGEYVEVFPPFLRELGIPHGTVFVHPISEQPDGKKFTIVLPMFLDRKDELKILTHEVGHYLLHYLLKINLNKAEKKSEIDSSLSYYAAYGKSADGVDTDRAEIEAECFALTFIMPKEKIQRDIEQGLDDESIAKNYGVSKNDIENRRNLLKSI